MKILSEFFKVVKIIANNAKWYSYFIKDRDQRPLLYNGLNFAC